MYEAGASAYLSKGTAFNIVCDTIRQVRERRSHREEPAGELTPLSPDWNGR
jgi:hypothetical protein